MNGFLLTRDLLPMPILSILLLSLQRVLKKNKTDFLCYIGYRNFINDLIKHVLLLILVHVRLLFCSNCKLHALLLLKNIGLDTMILFTKGTELTIFGQLKILMMFSINLNLKTFRLLNCLNMIFLHCILRYLIIL